MTCCSIDTEALAAFVLGHHPHLLSMMQEDFWERSALLLTPEDRTFFESVSRAIHELKQALQVLARAERVKPAILTEMGRDLNQFAGPFLERVQEPFALRLPRLPIWHPSKLSETLVTLSGRLLLPSRQSHRWRDLGSLLGAYRRDLRSWISLRDRPAKARLNRLHALGPMLTALDGRPFPKRLIDLAKSIDAAATHRKLAIGAGDRSRLYQRYRDVCRLDLEIQHAFRGQPSPRPILTLHRNTLIFGGKRMSLANMGKTESACLWVLAERPGIQVPRQEIIEEAALAVTVRELGQIMTRVRNALRSLAKSSGHRESNDHPVAATCLIGGLRKLGFPFRPFCLELDPGLVRLSRR
jgi:hypothetical protein